MFNITVMEDTLKTMEKSESRPKPLILPDGLDCCTLAKLLIDIIERKAKHVKVETDRLCLLKASQILLSNSKDFEEFADTSSSETVQSESPKCPNCNSTSKLDDAENANTLLNTSITEEKSSSPTLVANCQTKTKLAPKTFYGYPLLKGDGCVPRVIPLEATDEDPIQRDPRLKANMCCCIYSVCRHANEFEALACKIQCRHKTAIEAGDNKRIRLTRSIYSCKAMKRSGYGSNNTQASKMEETAVLPAEQMAEATIDDDKKIDVSGECESNTSENVEGNVSNSTDDFNCVPMDCDSDGIDACQQQSKVVESDVAAQEMHTDQSNDAEELLPFKETQPPLPPEDAPQEKLPPLPPIQNKGRLTSTNVCSKAKKSKRSNHSTQDGYNAWGTNPNAQVWFAQNYRMNMQSMHQPVVPNECFFQQNLYARNMDNMIMREHNWQQMQMCNPMQVPWAFRNYSQ